MSHKQIRYSVLFAFAILSFAFLMSVVSISGAVRPNRPPSQVKESPTPQSPSLLIDEFSNPDRMSVLGTFWRGLTDQVMGDVSLENNGGFVQVALPLTGSGADKVPASSLRGPSCP